MIKTVHIQNFKSINDEKLDFKPFTLLTGTNSSGKSSVLQAINLFIQSPNNNPKKSMYIKEFTEHLRRFDEIRNKQNNNDTVHIQLNESSIEIKKDKIEENINSNLCFEENFYYLCANRTLVSDITKEELDIKFGINGEFITSYFNSHSYNPISDFFIESKEESEILAYYLDVWIQRILDIKFSFNVTKNIDTIIARYVQKNLNAEFIPYNVATGLNFVTKILIVGLSLKRGDVFVVENPEIHLHPKAISNLVDFFALLVSNGVQVILETHSNYLISKLRILVYKEKLKHDSLIIYYKDQSYDNFESIFVNSSGFFSNEDGKKIAFPTGFLDNGLAELMEIR